MSFSVATKLLLMNSPVAPVSSRAVTPFTSAIYVVWIPTLRFSELGEGFAAIT